MLKTLRTLTAVAAIAAAGLPQMANAALVSTTMDFEGVNTALATYYNTSDFGFATINNLGALSTSKGSPPYNIVPENHALINSCGVIDCLADAVEIDFAGGLQSDGTANTAISFDINVSSITLQIVLIDSAGNESTIGFLPDPATVSGWMRDRFTYTAAAGSYKGLRFVGDPDLWAIDNLTFSVTDTSTNNVPEPSSVALVALALAGAASIARRRRQD